MKGIAQACAFSSPFGSPVSAVDVQPTIRISDYNGVRGMGATQLLFSCIQVLSMRNTTQRDDPSRVRLPKSPALRERPASDDPLLKSEEWLRLAAQGWPVGLWYWNEETRRVFWDAKTCEIFGVSTEGEKTLETFYGSLHPDDLERVKKVWRYQLEHRLPCDVEYRVVRPDGTMRWIHARGSGYYDKTGKPLRMVGVHFDVTERKQAERERLELSGRLINAQEQERTRLARELHDDFSQRIALLAVDLEKIAKMTEQSSAEASSRARELREIVCEIGSDLHSLSHRLHSPKLDVLGLARCVGAFCAEFGKQEGIQVDFVHLDIRQPIPSETTLCLFRIVQEGLRNVRKHSRATRAEVRLKGTPEAISLTLSDNGVGFDPSNTPSDGIGIGSMKERARMLDGTFEVVSQPMQGTQIAVTVPLKSMRTAA